MICEIINPSDPYTMECETFLIGAVAVALLGNGKMGLHSEDGELSTPILFGWDDWFKGEGVTDLSAFLDENKAIIADALRSVRIGDFADRRAEAVAIKHMTPAAVQGYRAEIHDARRTSMNDIGSRAWQLAKRLRGDDTAEVPAEKTIVLTGP